MTDSTIETSNLVNIDTKIYVDPSLQSDLLYHWTVADNELVEIPYIKYQIKETDFRVKTASITVPTQLDLTRAVHLIKIVSSQHENFVGFILSDEFTENKDGSYTYQCQDMSRQYQTKLELNMTGSVTVYRALKWLLTRGGIPTTGKISDKMKSDWKDFLSGLQPIGMYNQSLWGNYIKMNSMEYKPNMIIRNKSFMETIRDLTIGYMRYVDVYFDDNGRLQIEPFSVKDWIKSGLYLTTGDVIERKFKFDTTNAITGVLIAAEEEGKIGKKYTSTDVLGLNLAAFFGYLNDSASNPNQSSKSSSGSSTSNAVKKSSSNKSTNVSKNGNPYNNKAKRIIVSEDRGGTPGFKSGIIQKLKNDGWSVTDLGTGPGTHSRSYDILSSKYSVNLTLYNGVDPKTIDEPVTGWLKGRHEKYGVQLVQMFDSHGWVKKTGTYNKKGIYYKRHGDFQGYRVPKAWDDNYSGARSGVLIEDLHKWYLKYYPRVIYCCGTSVAEAYAQFAAGGYFRYKGIK